jgi:hypothetical protein
LNKKRSFWVWLDIWIQGGEIFSSRSEWLTRAFPGAYKTENFFDSFCSNSPSSLFFFKMRWLVDPTTVILLSRHITNRVSISSI